MALASREDSKDITQIANQTTECAQETANEGKNGSEETANNRKDQTDEISDEGTRSGNVSNFFVIRQRPVNVHKGRKQGFENILIMRRARGKKSQYGTDNAKNELL